MECRCQQAADRQKYIDQGQSLNVMIADSAIKGCKQACNQGLGIGHQDSVLIARCEQSASCRTRHPQLCGL